MIVDCGIKNYGVEVWIEALLLAAPNSKFLPIGCWSFRINGTLSLYQPLRRSNSELTQK